MAGGNRSSLDLPLAGMDAAVLGRFIPGVGAACGLQHSRLRHHRGASSAGNCMAGQTLWAKRRSAASCTCVPLDSLETASAEKSKRALFSVSGMQIVAPSSLRVSATGLEAWLEGKTSGRAETHSESVTCVTTCAWRYSYLETSCGSTSSHTCARPSWSYLRL